MGRPGVWTGGRRPPSAYSVSPEAFWAHTSPEPNTGCWIWTGPYSNSLGYGYANINGWKWGAHIYALYLAGGCPLRRTRKKLVVMHRCDNRWCVNPAHLSLGTQRQNVIDCWRRGRRGSHV